MSEYTESKKAMELKYGSNKKEGIQQIVENCWKLLDIEQKARRDERAKQKQKEEEEEAKRQEEIKRNNEKRATGEF